jgi:hypothetical protein
VESKNEHELKRRLKAIGLSEGAITAAWPQWWSEDADASPSARLELHFSIARKLGIDPRSLLDAEGTPRFVWRDEARFKHLSGESDIDRASISSFGRAVGALIVEATTGVARDVPDPQSLRTAFLRSQPFVRLVDLLALCWAIGTPTIHLRVFPRLQKRMAAMSVRVSGRGAILLARDSNYPAWIAFYLAHELGHLALGHVHGEGAIVDMQSENWSAAHDDVEERDADRYALELLTGRPDLTVVTESKNYNAAGLADAVIGAGNQLGVEPGTLALCFGFATKNWAVVNSAMHFIYATSQPVWQQVNDLALRELDLDQIPDDSRSYIATILGAA